MTRKEIKIQKIINLVNYIKKFKPCRDTIIRVCKEVKLTKTCIAFLLKIGIVRRERGRYEYVGQPSYDFIYKTIQSNI